MDNNTQTTPEVTPETSNIPNNISETSAVPEVTPEVPSIPLSEFRGTTLQLLGWRLLGSLLSIVTLGIGAPWAQCMIYRWETAHSYVNGKRLVFDGKGLQLLGKYLLWGLLIIVTFGIYIIFIPVRMHKWKASHTRFAKDGESAQSLSGLMILGIVLGTIAAGSLLFTFTKPLTAGLSAKLSELTESAFSEENIFEKLLNGLKKDEEPDDPYGQLYNDQYGEGEVFINNGVTMQIIDNGNGTFTIIYGSTESTGEQTGDEWRFDDTDQGNYDHQDAYSFTDDSRIIGGWLLRAILQEGAELEAGELQLAADGTFSYFNDIFSRSMGNWHADGLADTYYKGHYTFYDGILTLYYTQYFEHLYSSEPGKWVSTDKVVTQTITFADNGNAVYFSQLSSVFRHNGYFEPIEYCPRMTGSIGDMLDAIYANGIN